jgi:hypothetical protein
MSIARVVLLRRIGSALRGEPRRQAATAARSRVLNHGCAGNPAKTVQIMTE